MQLDLVNVMNLQVAAVTDLLNRFIKLRTVCHTSNMKFKRSCFNKKFELMLTRRVKACSSSGSVV